MGFQNEIKIFEEYVSVMQVKYLNSRWKVDVIILNIYWIYPFYDVHLFSLKMAGFWSTFNTFSGIRVGNK